MMLARKGDSKLMMHWNTNHCKFCMHIAYLLQSYMLLSLFSHMIIYVEPSLCLSLLPPYLPAVVYAYSIVVSHGCHHTYLPLLICIVSVHLRFFFNNVVLYLYNNNLIQILQETLCPWHQNCSHEVPAPGRGTATISLEVASMSIFLIGGLQNHSLFLPSDSNLLRCLVWIISITSVPLCCLIHTVGSYVDSHTLKQKRGGQTQGGERLSRERHQMTN